MFLGLARLRYAFGLLCFFFCFFVVPLLSRFDIDDGREMLRNRQFATN